MILTVTLNAAIDKRYVVQDFQAGEVNRVKECSYVPGGKGLNVSKPAALAGADVLATGFVGGHAGQFIEEALKPFGIHTAFYHLKEESRSCINIWDAHTGLQTEFLEPGFEVTRQEMEAFLEQFTGNLQTADVTVISGSVPRGLSGKDYQCMIARCRRAGKPVILDTSGVLLEQGIEAGPTMIKPNLDEIRMLTGKSCSELSQMLHAAEEIHRSGVELVVVSLGGDGSLAVGREGSFRARVPRIDTVNTVGCGDAMTAGFALGMERGLGLAETLRLASAISAASALQEQTGIFLKEDMERLLPQIQITSL